MKIEALWQEMETEARIGTTAAWLTRYALPQSPHPLLVGLETQNNQRSFLLPLSKSIIPARHEWPQCRGLEILSILLSGQPYLVIRLRDLAFVDIFTALTEDVAPRIASTSTPVEAVKVLFGRLARWQKFLSAGTSGLSLEKQRGLYGELFLLRNHLLPNLGSSVAIAGWNGPQKAHQDFQFSNGAIEVKTTTANQPLLIHITSERQLDDKGIKALFLHVIVLDERETENTGSGGSGQSLPEIIQDIRLYLSNEPKTAEIFDDLLLDVGYLETDALRYERILFSLRNELTFHVTKGFPKLVENDLPTGIGNVVYELSLASCQTFSVSMQSMMSNLKSKNTKTQKNE